jgi:DNA-binding Lrp family transcriptional regulator
MKKMTFKADSLNLKILKDLLADGRKPFAEIAEENNVSKEVVAKRFKQLKVTGVILGFTIQNSVKCYHASFVANILLHVQRGKTEYVTQAVNRIPNVVHTYSLPLEQDILVEVVLKNIEDLENTKNLCQKIPDVLRTEVTVWTGFRNTPENLSIFQIEQPPIQEASERISSTQKKQNNDIDEVDKAIIDKLALNGRMPFAEIANPLGISKETVGRRYEKLKQNGDLKVIIQIDPTKLGYYAFGTFNFSFSQETSGANIEKICQTPDVNRLTKSAGYQDLKFTLMIRDIHHFTETQEQVANLPNLTDVTANIRNMLYPWPMRREFISTF